MINHWNQTIQDQRWGVIEIRISHLEIKLDNNQAGWISTENLITTAVSLKSYLIFDVSVKRQFESSKKYSNIKASNTTFFAHAFMNLVN